MAGLLAIAGMAWSAVPLAAQEQVVAGSGATMRYLANSSDPGIGTSWTSVGFNDSAWSSGTFGVGFDTGGSAVNLLQSTVPSGTNSVYTRTQFSVPDPSAIFNVLIGADYDDGWVAWINGIEVYRSPEISAGTVTWNQTTGLHESSNGPVPIYLPRIDITTTATAALQPGVNLLAVAVFNAGSGSSDLVVVPELILNNQADVIRGPYLQQGSDTQIVVRWRTDGVADGRIWFGDAPGNLTSTAGDPALVVDHEIKLSNLTPDTTYFYALGDSAGPIVGDNADHFWTTAPPIGTGKPTRVWVVGDSGTADANAAAVRDAYAAFSAGRATDLWLMLGDNAYNDGRDVEYQSAVFDMYSDLLRSTVVWPTLGNHDALSATSASESGPYYDIFSLPRSGEAGGIASGTEAYYSFDYANIHFIVLDSADSNLSGTGPMLAWMEQDLLSTLQDWVIAFWHHPPYTKGSHNSDTESALISMRSNFLPVLEANGVDLVLGGHSHAYERSFFIDGHYGTSTTFNASHVVDGGDGQEDGDGIYTKPDLGPAPHQGAVYVVAGSSSKVSGGSLNHPAMFQSLNELGSVVLDIDGGRLDATFLDDAGTIRDRFSIQKGQVAQVPVADFQAVPLSGDAPLAVQFTDSSSNLPTQWSWDFDDIGVADSSQRSPVFEYSVPGNYSVRLTSSNAAGTDDELKPAWICVTDPARVPSAVVATDAQTLSWAAGPSGTTFDVAGGDLIGLLANGGDFAQSNVGLLVQGSTLNEVTLPATNGALFFLVRATDCAGAALGWDSGGTGQSQPRDLGGL